MKVLITGGAGFIGSHVAEHFIKQQHDVYVVDNLSSGYRANIPFIDDDHFFHTDIRNYDEIESIIQTHQFDIIIHLAAVVSVVDTVENPEESNDVNISALVHLLELCRKHLSHLKKFIFASSAAVYGNETTLPKSINSHIQPESPYAIQKYSSEQYVKLYHTLYHLPTTSLRFFNVYGPKQDPQSQYSGVLSIMKNCFDHDKTFTFFGDGEQTRDFVYVKDIVQAVQVVLKQQASDGQVYNVGTSQPTSLLAIYKTFVSLYQKEIPVAFADPRDGDVKHSYADIEPLKQLGFLNRYTLQEGLDEYLKFEMNH
ncbi:SDR family NAD(P)-dependent oxidoreductase [Staphylococcus ursi]|uniref:SDR family NAD(P)-dependent oxidoreductase n=1 Tax=Staphylococcus sp. MI 10-1553 TaxID=1912064 RepID=UPI001397E1CF|nr:SDR family NAD(P)-dependent oxidoreductase [Staphylococcus sp. MI 10-1553]QHW36263.1 SDR family NAD(P)-dependent oxidoreductase [Staphylococcus sp. MI 10-1553]